jgi:hypothetical protein
MKQEVTTINTNQNSRSLPYPKLMISDKGTIVLFSNRATGVVLLQGSSSYKIGFHSFAWDLTAFSDYYEAITLQNELP